MYADLLLTGDKILTLDAAQPVVEAIAIRGKHIVAIGTQEDLAALIGTPTNVISTHGLTVVPGLTDSHLHLLSWGLTLAQVDLRSAHSLEEIRQQISAFLAANPVEPGQWILGRGWDQNQLLEKRFPTKADLDKIAPNNPIFVTRVCGHVATLNQVALDILGLDSTSPDPAGGQLGRDATGELTGVLLEEGAINLVRRALPMPTVDDLAQALKTAAQGAVSAGLTEVHSDDLGYSNGFSRAIQAYKKLEDQQELPLRIRLELLVNSYQELKKLLSEIDSCSPCLSPSGKVNLGPIKILADGSLGARTAALEQPYSDAPGERGLMNLEAEELTQMVTLAHNAGFSVAIHVIGDRAARLALEAIETAQTLHPRPEARHRLVHCQIMNEVLWAKMQQLGVAGDIQPRFVASDWPIVTNRIGKKRARTSYAWKSMLARGIHLAGGSDCPVEPLDPLLGMHAALTRTNLAGQPAGGWQPEEKLDPGEALALFTQGPAYVADVENERGRLVPGYLADLTAFAGDYLTAPIETTLANDVRLTIADGQIVYRRDI
ncbi:MAG: amidohydrolase [Firmicutes bacterium]|nr:amidohydrolase [Bacillota bacterium]